MVVCSYFTDTDRCRDFAEAMLAAERKGVISPEAAAQSRQRVHSLLLKAPQNEVRQLSPEVLAQHASAGPLFSAETAEVI
jgi:hypothetical protein